MKLRVHRRLRFQLAHQHRLATADWNRYVERLLGLTPQEQSEQDRRQAEFWEEIQSILNKATPRVIQDANKQAVALTLSELVEPAAEEPTGISYLNEKDQVVAPKKYVVAKKTTGEIVGEFDVLSDAEEVIAKARRAKKQALVLL